MIEINPPKKSGKIDREGPPADNATPPKCPVHKRLYAFVLARLGHMGFLDISAFLRPFNLRDKKEFGAKLKPNGHKPENC